VSDPDLPPDRAVSRAERAESGCTGQGALVSSVHSGGALPKRRARADAL